ncbi:phosphoribosylglycinamide formyltransferase [Paralimibaculum aggregatum]|uniref:Phosphoribosylglycinamide formyltransferase n=1 Tax=Paralimibaculum aggregatum TaxID=3036245 RepID=A0ABQ6LQP2_9RHOB|nr:phosphoribosylglycinamide formyltransferase [Limibaculum sp. NKW23]GMG83294.1 phosphoribosylglycinamide formyltransferase [Limibaculum sp. NKW23]
MSRAVGILISGRGSNMTALVEAMQRAPGPAHPALVLSNRPGAGGLETAARLGVPTAVVDHRAFPDRERFDAAVNSRLAEAGVELVACAGFMRIMTPVLTGAWAGRMLNIHPSLLPLFPGLDTHARALAAGVAIHGCTVHEVTQELDAGPILGQAAVPVRPGDTEASLAARVLEQEHRLYPRVLAAFAADPAAARAGRVALFAAGSA